MIRPPRRHGPWLHPHRRHIRRPPRPSASTPRARPLICRGGVGLVVACAGSKGHFDEPVEEEGAGDAADDDACYGAAAETVAICGVCVGVAVCLAGLEEELGGCGGGKFLLGVDVSI